MQEESYSPSGCKCDFRYGKLQYYGIQTFMRSNNFIRSDGGGGDGGYGGGYDNNG
jgi:hypothetical protein